MFCPLINLKPKYIKMLKKIAPFFNMNVVVSFTYTDSGSNWNIELVDQLFGTF